MTLYEIERLKPEIEAELNAREIRDTMRSAGKTWIRTLTEDELAVGERRILDFENCDVVVVRGADAYYVFDNACPHLNLPFYERRALSEDDLRRPDGTLRPTESTITDDLGLVCRWHESCFDLQTGEIRDWAATLNEDGLAPGQAYLGNISKNRAKLKTYACLVRDGYLWISLE